MWSTELAVMASMVVLNSVFAAYEIALASVTRARLQILIQHHGARAQAALAMKDQMEASLAAVQLGITLFGAIAAATGGAEAGESLMPYLQNTLGLSAARAEALAIALIVLPLTVVTIIFGELVPKVFAIRNNEWVCLRLSPVMRWFALSVWPAVWCFETVVRAITNWSERRLKHRLKVRGQAESVELQDLWAVTALARAARLIGPQEELMIRGAARLSRRNVREIMLAAEYISMLDVHASLSAALLAAHLDMHTRFPVTDEPGNPQAILGYVNFKDIVLLMHLNPTEASLRSIVRPVLRLADDLPLSIALERLTHEHTHIALVCDKAGRVVGMITLEDILEELVGDIQDEYDRLPGFASRTGGDWIVGGGILLTRLRDVTSLDLTVPARPELRTLSDWILDRLGRPVRGGDVVAWEQRSLLVRKVRRQRVLEAQIRMSGFDPCVLEKAPGKESTNA